MVMDEVHNEDKTITMSIDVSSFDVEEIKKELTNWFESHRIGMSGFKIKVKKCT